MKKLAANGIAQIVHEGGVINAKNGILTVDDNLEEMARSHGATDIPPDDGVKMIEKIVEVPAKDDTDPNSKGASDNIDEMKRGELTASLSALGVSFKMPITNEDLRALLRGELARRFAPKPADQAAAPTGAGEGTPPAAAPEGSSQS